MWKTALLSGLVVSALALPPALAAVAPAPSTALAVEQIVEKNIAARGGFEAWRAVRTMSFSGKMDAGGKQNAQLPFSMELKRPRKSRTEIEFARDTAVQVYDGARGWKVRPFLGRKDVEPFTAAELEAASTQADLDGPLVDHAQKGTTVQLDGVEKVEGSDAYKLKLTLKGGQVRHLWVDARTFLEVKIEGTPRLMDGKPHRVEIFYRDYRAVDGLMIPHVLETAVAGTKQTHKTTIEKIVVNPVLADSRFARPRPDASPGAEDHSAAGAKAGSGDGSDRPNSGS
ncbi:MAG: outer membrane lipoprotein-sorting protein [Acidobacteria bacterium]|nr:outer membrane lipoprotein-sorting protein [Acidobacteriota bacterium]